MSTILYPSPIFGPVHSRRLGVSLGINLLPPDGKVCTFDCLYCECGFNATHRQHNQLPSREAVRKALEECLSRMLANGETPDVLTFAGNGEPTAHPEFSGIVDDTLALRNRYFPHAKVSVLSNATLIDRDAVMEALLKVDNNILKLDTVNPDYIHRVDRPTAAYDVAALTERMRLFEGHCIIQTMFLKGMDSDGQSVDNTTDDYVLPWLEVVRRIRPEKVMVYTIDRDTPCTSLLKATPAELDRIVELVSGCGIECSASY